MKTRTFVWALVCVLALGAVTPAAAAEPRSAAAHLGLGIASVAATMIYGPVKVLYAVGGSTVAGLAYLFSAGRLDTAQTILQPAVRGDYVVTPEHLTYNQPLCFVGRDPASDPNPYRK